MIDKRLSLWLIITLAVFTSMNLAAAGPDSHDTWRGLQSMMGSEEFKAAGLDKLSPEELHRLDQWLMHFLAYDSQQLIKTDTDIQNLQKSPVRRRIAGHFTGWSGDTLFTLDNGEVWKQRLPGRYAISLENPEIEIFRNLLGFFELKVVKTGSKIAVTRVK